MLSAMAAPLKEICVSFERYKIDQKLGEVLGGFSSTLETLRARSCTLNGFNVRFARLESLELETEAPLDITSLARVSPAVRDLRVDISLNWVELEWLSIRASNLQAQPSLNMSLRTIRGHVLAHLVMLLARAIDVTQLELVICFPIDRYMWDCPMITHAVLELLKTMSLNNRSVTVTQLDIRLYRPYHTIPMKWAHHEDPMLLYFRDRLDILGFARNVADILPALTKLTVYVDYVSVTDWDVEREFDGAVALKQTSWRQL
ncbi:hypothetical protein CERSUDRAFT_127418 [Gelatoporia subvermispora B]|uniref:Uncharacterized protein n=1 Tax=Ceriporiopsis subvermispora (strain B) TaxID=914234 RepID=M2QXZ6_CERS8|nr:hypothetical protein CERSUDRAFT_127418 [Gelatoporia subvermispora B]